jgi:hypothetical protein
MNAGAITMTFALAIGEMGLVPGLAAAQSWPTRPIRLKLADIKSE